MFRTVFAAVLVAMLGSAGMASAQQAESGSVDEEAAGSGLACYGMVGTLQENEDACTFIINHSRRDVAAEAWLYRGHARIQLGKRVEAIDDYNVVIRRQPRNFVAWQWRGIAFTELKQWEPGLADLLAAVKLAPMNPETHNSLCWALAMQGTDLNRALSYCNIGVGLQPTWPVVRDSRALVYLKMGEFDKALADYEFCLRLDPAYAHYLYGRALVLKRLGREAEATEARDEALETDPNVAAKYDSYGVAW